MQRHVLKLAIARSMTYRYWLTTLLNSLCHSSSSPSAGFLNGVVTPHPTYPLSAKAFDSLKCWSSWRSNALASWVFPGSGSEMYRRFPERSHTYWCWFPVSLCLPDHRSFLSFHDQQGCSEPSITATRPARPLAASARSGSKSLSAFTITPSRVEMVSEITGWLTNNSSAITSSVILFLKYIRVAFRPCANVKPRGRPTPLSQVTSSLTRRRSSPN